MAKSQMKGLIYFSFDVTFFSDVKIKVLQSRFGADGVTLYIYLLCSIYKEGYYLKIDDDFNDVVALDLGMSHEKIGLILNFLLGRSLFDDKLFKSDKVLTSHGIQLRFQDGVKTRALKKSVSVNEKFWLLSEDETRSFIEVRPIENKSEIYIDKSKIYPNNSESYATKKSKEKKSKVNERKETTQIDSVKKVQALYEQNIGTMPPAIYGDVVGYVEKNISIDLICECIKKAVGANKPTWNYVKGILNNSLAEGKTAADLTKATKPSYNNRDTSYDIDEIDKFWDDVPKLI